MKRTIKEVYDLIKEKRNYAEIDYRTKTINGTPVDGEILRVMLGNLQAYNDVLCLIESSHLLEENKPVIKCEGIEALRNLTQVAYGNSDDIDNKIKNYFEIIEKSLKDYYRLNEEELLLSATRDLPNLKKKLKALEIIKKNGVDTKKLMDSSCWDSYDELDNGFNETPITQNEYDLLKEVLL